jgi:dihydrofolate reductase
MTTPFIIVAVTADGFIAKNPTHAAMWTSKDDKKRFVEITKRAGVVVMGETTFKTLPKPLKDRVNIVYSFDKQFEGAEVTQKSPADLIKELDERGFKEIAICGGSSIYTMFMKSGLIKKLYLTIEPAIFGAGMKLFNEDIDMKLKLVSSTVGESGSLLLEYDVVGKMEY